MAPKKGKPPNKQKKQPVPTPTTTTTTRTPIATPAPIPTPTPTPTPKVVGSIPVVDPPISLESLFSSLDRHVKDNDYPLIIQVADQILGQAPGDPDAIQCKVVALIQDDKIDEALSEINSRKTATVNLSYHKAYCLYRKNRLEEAMKSLKGEERTSSVLQLEAQILYRLGDFGKCVETYQNCLQNNKDSIELKTNIIAAYISGGRPQEVPALIEALKVRPSSSFELAYNTACAQIESGSLKTAEDLLLLAQRIGQETLIEEEYTNEQVENELAPISVQLAYVRQVQGRSTEAVESYNNLLKKKLTDTTSIAVATNNLLALKSTKDAHDGLKKFDRIVEKNAPQHPLQFAEGLEHKLSLRQKEALSINRVLLLLHANKVVQARELVLALLERFPKSEVPVILHATLLTKEGKLSEAEELLKKYMERNPRKSRNVLLAHAQIATMAGHHAVSAESLEHVLEWQHKPSMVATLVALKEKGGDIKGAEETLDSAIQRWDNHMGEEDTGSLEIMLKAAAEFKLKHKNMEAASLLFERLIKSSSSSSVLAEKALIGLVRSAANLDLGKAELYEKKLPSLPGLASISVDALERKINAAPSGIELSKDGSSSFEAIDKSKSKEKRKRKRIRFPKNFDPANPGPLPDPERWLPKKERSSYRPRRKDKRAAHVRGAQGSMGKEKSMETTQNGSNNSNAAVPSKPSVNKGVAKDSSKPSSSSSNKSNKKKARR